MNMEKACERVLEKMPDMRINSILQLDSGWVFSFCNAQGQGAIISPMLVKKETGEITDFFPPDHLDELEDAVELKVPDRYS